MKTNNWLTNTIIAHRGLHCEGTPENTLSAFAKAIEAHYAIETDLHMTTDGVVVVFHDDDMKRLTGYDKDIRECTYDEIRNLTIMDSAEKIPTFEQFLHFIDGRVPLLIEVKDHKNIGECEEKILKYLDCYDGEFALQSFNPFIVKYFAEHAPTYTRGQLASDFKDNKTLAWYKKLLLRNLFFIKSNKSQFVSYDVDALPCSAVKRASKHLPIIGWTVRSQAQLENKGQYFDNFIFEDFIPTVKSEDVTVSPDDNISLI